MTIRDGFIFSGAVIVISVWIFALVNTFAYKNKVRNKDNG
jgi:hypothetical protein